MKPGLDLWLTVWCNMNMTNFFLINFLNNQNITYHSVAYSTIEKTLDFLWEKLHNKSILMVRVGDSLVYHTFNNKETIGKALIKNKKKRNITIKFSEGFIEVIPMCLDE